MNNVRSTISWLEKSHQNHHCDYHYHQLNHNQTKFMSWLMSLLMCLFWALKWRAQQSRKRTGFSWSGYWISRCTLKEICPTSGQKRWERMRAPVSDLDGLINPLPLNNSIVWLLILVSLGSLEAKSWKNTSAKLIYLTGTFVRTWGGLE